MVLLIGVGDDGIVCQALHLIPSTEGKAIPGIWVLSCQVTKQLTFVETLTKLQMLDI
jgi:hypothetical protein